MKALWIPILGSLVCLPVHADSAPVSDPAANSQVEIQAVRVVLSKQGQTGTVDQRIHISPKNATPTNGTPVMVVGFRIRLPKDAPAPQWIPPVPEWVRQEKDALVIAGELPVEGRSISLRYNLPIEDGTMRFIQHLGHRIGSLQVLSTWTVGGVKLRVAGLAESAIRDMGKMEVLLTIGRDIKNGKIDITLSGLDASESMLMRTIALATGLFSLVIGLMLWLRNRVRSG